MLEKANSVENKTEPLSAAFHKRKCSHTKERPAEGIIEKKM